MLKVFNMKTSFVGTKRAPIVGAMSFIEDKKKQKQNMAQTKNTSTNTPSFLKITGKQQN